MSKLLKKVATTVIGLMFLSGVTWAEVNDDNLGSQVFIYQSIDIDKTSILELNTKELECLAHNIFFESGAESAEGKIAVGMVTLNRKNSVKWPKTICEVVQQRSTVVRKITQNEEVNTVNVIVCQFSWTCTKRRHINKNTPQWIESYQIAQYLLKGGHRAFTEDYGKLYYFHATYINPGWRNLQKVIRIGNHVFYTDRS
jgi:N-acetylmuramoyl-L-alanine amidase